MWIPKQRESGKWCCENQNLDTTDQVWDTEAEAAAWANETNTQWAIELEAIKKRAAARRAERAASPLYRGLRQ